MPETPANIVYRISSYYINYALKLLSLTVCDLTRKIIKLMTERQRAQTFPNSVSLCFH